MSLVYKKKIYFEGFDCILSWYYSIKNRNLSLKITNTEPEIVQKVLDYAIYHAETGIAPNDDPLDINSFGLINRIEQANFYLVTDLYSEKTELYSTKLVENPPPYDPRDQYTDGIIDAFDEDE